MIASSDIWSSNATNSNSSNSSFYFQTSFDLNMSTHPSQYSNLDNSNYDYQALPDISTNYLTDPYSQMFNNNYSGDSYSTSTSYNTTSMDYGSSNYLTTTESYQQVQSMYSNGNSSLSTNSSYLPLSQVDTQTDYQSSLSQWDASVIKMHSHDSMYIQSSVFYIIQKWMATCRFLLYLSMKKSRTFKRNKMSVF